MDEGETSERPRLSGEERAAEGEWSSEDMLPSKVVTLLEGILSRVQADHAEIEELRTLVAALSARVGALENAQPEGSRPSYPSLPRVMSFGGSVRSRADD